MAGWIRLGDAVNPSMGAWPRHPCRGHSRNRTHPAFDRILQPDPPRLRQIYRTHPAFDSFRDLSERRTALVGVDLGRHGRSTPCVDALRSIVEMFELDGDSSTHGVDPSDRGNLSEVGRCRSAGCQPHGCGCQAYMDVLAASPHSDTAPPSHGMPAFAVAGEVAGQRPALPGCRAQPCRKTHIKKTAGRGLLFRCNGAPGEIRTPDRLVRSQVLYPTELRAPIT